jgi:hypothetical protein
MRSTLRLSSSDRTDFTRSSAVAAKIPIPSLQELTLALQHQLFNVSQFVRRKPNIARQLYGVQPEFRRVAFSINMDVGRLVWLVAVKV